MSSKYRIIPLGGGGMDPSTKYGASISMSMDQDYILSVQLLDQDGNALGSEQTVDLPLESVVVGGSYDSATKSLILTLDNGNTITIPVGDLVSGLQTEITAQNPLSADLVADGTNNKVFTAAEKTKLDGLTVGDGTVTVTQDGQTLGSFTTNQSGDTTIDIPAAGGGNSTENQELLPLYFENISDSDIDVKLCLEYNIYGGSRPYNVNLSKSIDNINWTAITIPTTNNGSETITVPAKGRVYIKGTNTAFCKYQSGGYYNHYYFTLGNVQGFKSLDTKYIFVGGNLISLLLGDTFLTTTSTLILSNYALAKLFESGLYPNGDGYITHFEKMTFGLPYADVQPTYGSLDRVINSSVCSLNLSHPSIYFLPDTDCCRYVNNVLVNSRFIDINSLVTDTARQKNLHIGYTSNGVGISDYRQLTNTPTIPAAANDATITVHQEGQADQTFTLNQSGDQTINIAAGGGNAWYGTQAQFDALGTYDVDTDYFITDKLDYNTDIKNKPNLSGFATKAEVNSKNDEQDAAIDGKMSGHFMTQQEFDALGNNVPEGENYFIEGNTVQMVVTFQDQTTATYNVVID